MILVPGRVYCSGYALLRRVVSRPSFTDGPPIDCRSWRNSRSGRIFDSWWRHPWRATHRYSDCVLRLSGRNGPSRRATMSRFRPVALAVALALAGTTVALAQTTSGSSGATGGATPSSASGSSGVAGTPPSQSTASPTGTPQTGTSPTGTVRRLALRRLAPRRLAPRLTVLRRTRIPRKAR